MTLPFSKCPANTLAKQEMILTSIVCSSQQEHALLYYISSCHFIAIEVSTFVAWVKSSNEQQHVVIKFYFKSSRIPWKRNKTSKMCTVMTVRITHNSLYEGRELLEDEPHLGQSVSTRINENMEKTHATVMRDRRTKTRLNALESVRKRPGKFWKEICREGKFVQGLCHTT